MQTKFIYLDTNKCKACWKCVESCPSGVFRKIDILWHKHAKINSPADCTGCMQCTEICSSHALIPIKGPKGENRMDSQSKEMNFNKRAFIAVAMTVALILLAVSGIMNHKLQLEGLTTERHFWMSVHNMSAFIFSIVTLAHISCNWRSIINYVNKTRGMSLRREALFAIVFILIVVAVFSSHAFHVK